MTNKLTLNISAFLLFLSFSIFSDDVQVSQNKLLLDGNAFYIKGICYHPVPLGSKYRSFNKIDQDLALMKEAGINTIRVYEPIDDIEILNKISSYGIKVIISFGFNQNGFFDILSGTFIDYVEKYKDHDSILLWELGNEYNYHPEWFGGDIANWYKALNDASKKIHMIDKHHPVSTAHGDLPDEQARSLVSDIDMWGVNVYRWDQPVSILEQWAEVSDKPIYFAELGSDSYMTITRDIYEEGISELAQADANKIMLDAVIDNIELSAGTVIFQFADGLWKAGNPSKQDVGGWAPNSSGVPYDGTANEEFFGIVDIARNKKKSYEIVKTIFNKPVAN